MWHSSIKKKIQVFGFWMDGNGTDLETTRRFREENFTTYVRALESSRNEIQIWY